MNQEEIQSTDRVVKSLQSRLEDAVTSARRYSELHNAEMADHKATRTALSYTIGIAILLLIFIFALFVDINSKRKKISDLEEKIQLQLRKDELSLGFLAQADSVFYGDKILYPTDTLKMLVEGPFGNQFKLIITDYNGHDE